MAQKAFFVGPYQTGLVNATKPWLLPESAFSVLQNAYVWRGRVKKRLGSKFFTQSGTAVEHEQLLSRLRIKVDTTDGAGAGAGTVPGATFEIGQLFSIGTALYTVITAGVAQAMLKTDATTTATYSTTNGAYNFVGAPALTDVYWYPAEPVMGIVNHEISFINDEPTFAFDPQFAYYRVAGGWDRLGTALWAGTNSQFFWSTNYRGTLNDDYWLFVVNNNRADQIKYWTGAAWATIAPATRVAANYALQSARLIVSFKDRLIALNTIEEVGAAGVYQNFSNRVRWSQNGSPIAADAWYDNVPGKGGWLEAPTREAIITAKILKDRLIVYFERSTRELVYTGNQVLPFVWQIIDDKLGAESTFSSILLENSVLGIGESGVHQCDGLRVSRIDDSIPQEVFSIHNGHEGVERVAGIRDYENELAYWAFPSSVGSDISSDGPTFPNRMLVYNYKNSSWSFNDDSITAFGYLQNVDDLTWGACSYTWEEFNRFWRSGFLQSEAKNVLAGNQEGFTFLMDARKNDNAPALQITDIDITALPAIELTIQNHNLLENDFINIQFVQGVTNLDGIFEVAVVSSADTIILQQDATPVGTYTGGGLVSRVSKIDIRTKQFNFYKEAKRISINKIDFDVDRSSNGYIGVTFYSSTSRTSMAQEAIDSGTNLGTYTLDTYPYALYPQEADQDRLTRPVYIQAEGDCIQVQLTWTDAQMLDESNMKSAFELNSMTFYASPSGGRL